MKYVSKPDYAKTYATWNHAVTCKGTVQDMPHVGGCGHKFILDASDIFMTQDRKSFLWLCPCCNTNNLLDYKYLPKDIPFPCKADWMSAKKDDILMQIKLLSGEDGVVDACHQADISQHEINSIIARLKLVNQ